MSYFSVFWVELCKTLGKDGQEIKISTHLKKFHFGVENTVFIKNNEFLKKSDFWYMIYRKGPTLSQNYNIYKV